ncbi:hypothetical protein ACFLZF_00110 [Nanoarchaeota archaeon]
MISEATEGATTALLNYSENKIKQLVEFFKTKQLKFIGDKKTIEIAKETQKSGEWIFYKNYIKDKELLFIIKLGLVLRKIESNTDKLQDLKGKIKKKYNVKGLHIAYFVQNGILNRYVGILLDDLDSAKMLEDIISNILKNIEKYTIFTSSRDNKRSLLKNSLTITSAHKSNIFIISGIGFAAKIVRESQEDLKDVLDKYELEKISTGKKEILFFKLL